MTALDVLHFAEWLVAQPSTRVVGPGYEAGSRLLAEWLRSVGYQALHATGRPGVFWFGRDVAATPWVEAFDRSLAARMWQPVTVADAVAELDELLRPFADVPEE